MSAEHTTEPEVAPVAPLTAAEPPLQRTRSLALVSLFATAFFLNAALIFSVLPLFRKMVLPVLGALAARKFPVASGLARQENTSMFVSRGIGTVYAPVRIGCPPEVSIVTLRRKASF